MAPSNSERLRTNLSMCFWNVGGLKSKLYDKTQDISFIKNISQHDIVFLAETHLGYCDTIHIEGFHYFPVCRPISSNNRFFGGLAVLTKRHVRDGVKILPIRNTNFHWIKLEKDFFNLDKDIYICIIYFPPHNSSYMLNSDLETEILEQLQADIDKFSKLGNILLCGDLNARIGLGADFIENDNHTHIPIYKDYVSDCESPRNNQDSVMDARGKEFLDLCIGSSLRIVNGRSFGDSMGKFTCFTSRGSSVVDYTIVSQDLLQQLLYFHVSDFISTLSDAHCKLSWNLLASFKPCLDSKQYNNMPDKYIWNDKSSEDFLDALHHTDIKRKINDF